MDTENQLDNQEFEFGEFGFNELDSLQEQVALKNSAQNNEIEPELTKETESIQQVKNKDASEVLEDEYDIDDKYQKYLDSLPKEERERLEREAFEYELARDKEREIDDAYARQQMESEKDKEDSRVLEDERQYQKYLDSLQMEQEKIELEYSLAKMKQDLSQSQEEKQEQEVDLTYPAQKREFLSETLEIVDKGITPSIKESLEILEKLDEVEAQIAKKEKEFNAEQEKDSSSPSKTILDSEIDEALQRQQQEQQELHQKELESLQKEKETLEKNFEASIENLIKQGDVKDLLKNLQTLDEAFAKFLKKTKEECDLLAKQRIEKLELAMQNESVKEAVSGFVKELHANREEVKEQSKELESQKECFEALQVQQQKCLKGDEKSMRDARFELGQNLVWLNETHPTFKDNYSKFYKELEQTLKEPQKQKEKQQENSRERSA
ncbi:hypothetical protein [Helicobacter rodentium]|uniref:hypothetical protein n=1 Tax=Helicobacter rodentium TaxID=59617 RepID=UPI0023536512|nr:hypothetical protein [Helicobacter rodentium]